MSAVLHTLTRAVGRHPAATIIIVLLATIGLAAFIPQAELVNDNASFSPNTPQVQASQQLQQQFSDSATTTLQVVISDPDGDVISADGVTTVNTTIDVAHDVFGDALQTNPQTPAGVVSYLTPAQAAAQFLGTNLTQADDTAVDQLQQQALQQPTESPDTQQDAPGQRNRAGDISQLTQQLTSGDDPTNAQHGLVLLQLNRNAYPTDGDLIGAQNTFADKLQAADTPLQAVPFSFELISAPDSEFQTEVQTLGLVAAAVILIVLGFVLRARRGPKLGRGDAIRRSLADMATALLTVILAVIWVQGLQVLLGPDHLGLVGQASPPTQIVPILLLALGVDYAIHVQARYREELGEGLRNPAALVEALGPTVGIALLLSMVTTSVGFLTNLFSPIPAIRDLGVLSAVGIICAFILSLTFLPAVRSLLDRRAARHNRLAVDEVAPHEASVFTHMAMAGLRPALNHPIAMLTAASVLAAAGGYGLTQLETQFDVTAFLPADSPYVTTYETLTEQFNGGLAETTEVLITGEVLTPAVHNATAATADHLTDKPGIVTLGDGPAITSPTSVLAELTADNDQQTNALQQAKAAGLQPDGTVTADANMDDIYQPLHDTFPQVAGVINLDDGPPTLRMAVRTQSDTAGINTVTTTLTNAVQPIRNAGAQATVTSEAIINDDILTSLSDSQTQGLAITVIVVMVLLGLVYGIRSRQPGLGVLIMLPVVAVVLWTFGLMALTDIPFDPVTAVISALVIGVGVDFCIHLGERFVEDAQRHNWDTHHALQSSLHHTGAALAGSGATTMLGFSVLTTSSIVPFQRLGIVTIYAVGLSLLATLFVLPPILVLYARRHHHKPHTAEFHTTN